jgi:hypothetical protein
MDKTFEKYKPTVAYPVAPTRPRFPGRGFETPNSVRAYEAALEQYQRDEDVFKMKRTEFLTEQGRLLVVFWKDAFEDIGIPLDHPKADKMKSFAWEHCHSEGLHGVYNQLLLVWDELMK